MARRGNEGIAINSEPRVNERIHVDKVRLVGPGGEQVGVVRLEDALRLAQESGLDLVEVAPNSNPPVAKLMDYGKFKYESAQKVREARRNQSNTVIKSIRIGLKIDENDYRTKKGQAERFLSGGDKVKFDLRFKGREQSRPEMGVRLLRGLADELSELSTIEAAPRAEGRNMSMVLAPLRKKSEAKSDQRRRREAERESRKAREAQRASRSQGAHAPGPAGPGAWAPWERDARCASRALRDSRSASRRRRWSDFASDFLRSGAKTIDMLRPSARGAASIVDSSDSSSARPRSRRTPISGRDCSRPLKRRSNFTLSPPLRNRSAWPFLVL